MTLRAAATPPAATKAVVPRFDGVDLLRGLSILAVILLHIYIHLHSLVAVIIVSTELLFDKLHPTRTVPTLAIWSLSILFLSAILGAVVARFFSEPMNRLLRGAAPPRPQTLATINTDHSK